MSIIKGVKDGLDLFSDMKYMEKGMDHRPMDQVLGDVFAHVVRAPIVGGVGCGLGELVKSGVDLNRLLVAMVFGGMMAGALDLIQYRIRLKAIRPDLPL